MSCSWRSGFYVTSNPTSGYFSPTPRKCRLSTHRRRCGAGRATGDKGGQQSLLCALLPFRGLGKNSHRATKRGRFDASCAVRSGSGRISQHRVGRMTVHAPVVTPRCRRRLHTDSPPHRDDTARRPTPRLHQANRPPRCIYVAPGHACADFSQTLPGPARGRACVLQGEGFLSYTSHTACRLAPDLA